MDLDRFIFKNNQITLFPCFTFIPKTGVDYLIQGLFFLSADHSTWYMPTGFENWAFSQKRDSI